MRRGIAHALLVLLLAVGSGSLAAKESGDPEHDTLDGYQKSVNALAARADAQLRQIEAETKTLADRFAAEIVGKPFRNQPRMAGDLGGDEVCRQKPVLIAGVDDDDAMLRERTTPTPTATLSRADFDRWFAQIYGKQIGFARRYVAESAKTFSDLIDEMRRELDTAAGKADTLRLGGDWKRQQYRSIMHDLAPDGALRTIYFAVIQEHFGLIWLGATEVGGVTCLMQSELSEPGFTAETKVAEVRRQFEKLFHADRHQEADAVAQSVRAAVRSCAAVALRARDDAAARMRVLRDRLLDERERVRKNMLAWRDEAIALGPYAKTEDVAISRLYDTPAALSAENVAALHYGTVVPDYDAFVPGSYVRKLANAESFPAILSRDRLPLSVAIDTGCLYAPTDADRDLKEAYAAKYADLEADHPFLLTIDSSGPSISDEILPGAEENAGP